MKTRSLASLVVGTILALTATSLQAETLGELLEEAELGALIGTWVDEDSNGEGVTVTYAWRIENHALGMSVKTPDRTSEALIRVNPKSGDVVHDSVDSKGGIGSGKWSDEDGVATLTLNIVNADKEERSIKVTHKIIDNKKLVVGFQNPANGEGGEMTLVRKAE